MLTVSSVSVALFWDGLPGRSLGAAMLMSIAAIVLGYVVSLVWPKAHHPQVFGALATAALLGGLAYAGVPGAGLAIAVFVVAGLLVLVFGLM